MLHLRCPHQGCSIEVADDQVGEWIRCPHCGQLLIVDPARRDDNAPAQPQLPAIALDSEPKRAPATPAKTEQRLFAGLPPLAVMLGVRKGRGRNWKDESAIRAYMTETDWAALAAFEKVVSACRAVNAALVAGIVVTAITALLWWMAANVALDPSYGSRHWEGWLVTLALVIVGFATLGFSGRRLERMQLGTAVETATWSAAGVTFIFLVLAGRNVHALWSNTTPFAFALIAIPLQLGAAYSAAKAGLWVHHARKQVSPPEILNLLTEALAWLRAAGV